MDMRVQAERQGEAQTVHLLQVSIHRGNHRIDQHRLAGFLAAQQVGVSAGQGFKQLPKNHAGLSSKGWLFVSIHQ